MAICWAQRKGGEVGNQPLCVHNKHNDSGRPQEQEAAGR
jgi:hypothetical protein